MCDVHICIASDGDTGDLCNDVRKYMRDGFYQGGLQTFIR